MKYYNKSDHKVITLITSDDNLGLSQYYYHINSKYRYITMARRTRNNGKNNSNDILINVINNESEEGNGGENLDASNVIVRNSGHSSATDEVSPEGGNNLPGTTGTLVTQDNITYMLTPMNSSQGNGFSANTTVFSTGDHIAIPDSKLTQHYLSLSDSLRQEIKTCYS